MDAYVNILCILIVVILPIDNMAVTLHRPHLSQISSNHLHLAHHANGPGHFNGTRELNQEDIEYEIVKRKFEFFYLMKIIISIYYFSNLALGHVFRRNQ